MTITSSLRKYACFAVALLTVVSGTETAVAQTEAQTDARMSVTSGSSPSDSYESATTSTEQGRTPLIDSFEAAREWRLEKRRSALEDTEFRFNIRAFYFDREKFDGSESQAFTIGGWMGLKTGYFLDHLAFGVTGYTSQKLSGDQDKDGTSLLKPGQESYTVLGEAYADIRIVKNLHLFVGRKEFDTPYINGDDSRMTPNTFEAIALQGKVELGKDGATLKYGAGYFDRIKTRNSDRFVSMSEAAGAPLGVHRGVYTVGALFSKGNFTIGGIDYYSPDIINIGYAEATLKIPIGPDWEPKLAVQFTDQRSTGNELLQGSYFSARQVGIKAELPIKNALVTVAYTYNTDGADQRAPWSGFPTYTSVQVQDFNRAGEAAFLVRAGYEFPQVKGLSTYALGVFGMDPEAAGQYRQNEYNFNVQWAPPEGALKGLSLRVRYGIVQQDGGDVHDIQDFRVICNYGLKF